MAKKHTAKKSANKRGVPALDGWDLRKSALETILGPSLKEVYHSPMPLALGGMADVLAFPMKSAEGITYSTAELTGGESGQLASSLGSYEITICVREALPAAVNLVAELGRYSLTHVLEPGETMDLGTYFGEGSALCALLFWHAADPPPPPFQLEGVTCNLLLCMGITRPELKYKMKRGSEALVKKLQEADVFPFTDVGRASVL